MKQHALPILRFLASAALIAVAFLNLWHSNRLAEGLKPRNEDDVVVIEQRMTGIRNALLGIPYRSGDIGYMPASVLNGKQRTEREAARYVQTRYSMIPWNLKENTMAAPYVIVDSSAAADVAPIPEGFAKLYDSGDGLMLLQKTRPQ